MLPCQSNRAGNRGGAQTETSKGLCAGPRGRRRRRPRAMPMMPTVTISVAVSAPILRLGSSTALAPMPAPGATLAAMTGYRIRSQCTDRTSTNIFANPRQGVWRFAPFLLRTMADQLSGTDTDEGTLCEMSFIMRIFLALVAAVATPSSPSFRV